MSQLNSTLGCAGCPARGSCTRMYPASIVPRCSRRRPACCRRHRFRSRSRHSRHIAPGGHLGCACPVTCSANAPAHTNTHKHASVHSPSWHDITRCLAILYTLFCNQFTPELVACHCDYRASRATALGVCACPESSHKISLGFFIRVEAEIGVCVQFTGNRLLKFLSEPATHQAGP